MKIIFLLSMLMILSVQANFLEPMNKQFSIYSNIPFVRAANFKTYVELSGQSILEGRSDFHYYLMNLISMTGDINRSMNAVRSVDSLYRTNLRHSTDGFARAFSGQFKALLGEKYHKYNLATPKLIFTQAISNPTQFNTRNIDLIAAGTYSILSNGRLWVTLDLAKVNSGETISFEVSGYYNRVMAKLAQKVFHYFEDNRYANFKNPLPNISWMGPHPGYINIKSSKVNAQMACNLQGARLPTSKELFIGQGLTAVHGGINLPAAIFLHVSDTKKDYQGDVTNLYYYTSEVRGSSNRVDFWTGSVINQKALFVCVKDI